MAAAAQHETELVRTLKQFFETKQRSPAPAPATESVTLFGKKLSVGVGGVGGVGEDQKVQPSERLPPGAIVHLKELYEQHLKRRAPSRQADNGDAAATLPLLDARSNKRQRLDLDHRFAVTAAEGVRPIFHEIQNDLAAAARERAEVAKAAPLTLFYDGKVCVFDDITQDMVQAIMILAGNAAAPSSSETSSAMNAAAKETSRAGAAARPSFTLADLPQARKASLHRFLEKRKDRLFGKSDDKESFSSKSVSASASKPRTPPRSPPRKTFAAQQQQREIEPAAVQIH